MGKIKYAKIASLKTASDLHKYLQKIHVSLPFDAKLKAGPDSPLNQPFQHAGKNIGNRFCVLPLEGWDCRPDGRPGELTKRRWKRFGLSGAKLIWGGEACAVSDDARGHPQQLIINETTVEEIAQLLHLLMSTHQQHFECSEDLFVGLQLSHAGRFCYPDGKHIKPHLVYHHPILDRRCGLRGYPTLRDDQVEKIIDDFIKAAHLAQQAGFDFVDIKHCHGYLGHEFLSAVLRPGKFGGSFQNRTRFLREIVLGIQKNVPRLEIGVRLSLFDFLPFGRGQNGIGRPEKISGEYPFAFGGDAAGLGIDLTETIRLLDLLENLNIHLICTSAGSPYYNHHIQRPAFYPPWDGYLPPEDPLKSVARLINITAELKKKRPHMIFIGAGYSYLQQWLPHVAQHVIGHGMADFVGLARAILPYPEIVADILHGKSLDKKRLCRTIGHCVTAARHQLPSGCYPLDPFYKSRPEYAKLRRIITSGK
ncbi:MAG: NADH:flavin oxidoreductase [Phycisphaerae bacterium SM23_30]|nr:MAG: NADH:flavin oxidoreductase [Phycisphaerae bacterium SM23_30]